MQLPLTDQHWQTILDRDRSADGTWVLAVRTTRVYCRPSCKSRTPRRENIEIYAVPAAAELAGYRPCKRCRPTETALPDPSAALTQAVCAYLDAHIEEEAALTLEALGAQFGYDPSHLGETFKRLLGITPRQYADAQRLAALKRRLRSGESVTEAIHGAGYGSSSRVYERSDAALGMTPATYARGGKGAQIRYTLVRCDLGVLLVGMTDRGICRVTLTDDDAAAEASLRDEYPLAVVQRDDEALAAVVQAILDHIAGARPALDLPLDLRATAFQWKVWRALQEIPRGETRTYAQIAQAVGSPDAVRAVANACANNRAAIVIPCHRVVGSDGGLHGYRWGLERKRALLQQESSPAQDRHSSGTD